MKPFDFTKFRKDVTKKLGVVEGFHDPKTWISTGNYALNYRISGDFFRGVPLDGKVTVFAGESGSGKSYIVSGNMVKWCQQNGILVVLLDSEDAVDRSWVKALGVDPDDNNSIMRLPVSSPDDCATSIDMFMKQYVDTYKDEPENERQKVVFVIDSLGMLSTKTEQDQFEKGDMKGDMGRKAKALKALVTQCIRLFNGWPVGMVATNHTYKSQDMFNPDDVVSGGCLVAGTQVWLASGETKAIEDMEVGDVVRTMFGEQPVVNLWRYRKPTYTLHLADGATVTCSPEHKFLVVTEEGQVWKRAEDIAEGDELVSF